MYGVGGKDALKKGKRTVKITIYIVGKSLENTGMAFVENTK